MEQLLLFAERHQIFELLEVQFEVKAQHGGLALVVRLCQQVVGDFFQVAFGALLEATQVDYGALFLRAYRVLRYEFVVAENAEDVVQLLGHQIETLRQTTFACGIHAIFTRPLK